MSKKGEIEVGTMLMIFIGVIVCLALVPALGTFIGANTGTTDSGNFTKTAGAAGVTIDLVGQDLMNTPIVTNASNGVVINSGNYSITEGVSSTTGVKTIQYTTATGSAWASKSINISYTYGGAGFIDDAGGRAMVNLILVFAALSVAVFALFPSIKEFAGY